MVKGFEHVHPVELKLIARWSREKKSVPEIAALLGRHRSTIAKHLRRPARGSKVARLYTGLFTFPPSVRIFRHRSASVGVGQRRSQ